MACEMLGREYSHPMPLRFAGTSTAKRDLCTDWRCHGTYSALCLSVSLSLSLSLSLSPSVARFLSRALSLLLVLSLSRARAVSHTLSLPPTLSLSRTLSCSLTSTHHSDTFKIVGSGRSPNVECIPTLWQLEPHSPAVVVSPMLSIPPWPMLRRTLSWNKTVLSFLPSQDKQSVLKNKKGVSCNNLFVTFVTIIHKNHIRHTRMFANQSLRAVSFTSIVSKYACVKVIRRSKSMQMSAFCWLRRPRSDASLPSTTSCSARSSFCSAFSDLGSSKTDPSSPDLR